MQTTNWANEYMEGQGNFLSLAPGHLAYKIKTCFFFSKKLMGPFLNQILCLSVQVKENENLWTWCWSHDQDDRHAHICVNTLQNLLLQNRWTVFHEILICSTSWTSTYHSLFKWLPWVDLDLFYGKVKFGNLWISIGRCKSIAACDLKAGRPRQLIELVKVCVYWGSRSFLDLGPKSFTYKK